MNDEKYDLLASLLLSRLSFGTAGIRGKMGPGYSRMNELVIIQTSQGLARYLISVYGENSVESASSVVIGHDARHNSRKFAERTAGAFIQAGFKVYLFGKIVPTPFIPFAIQHLGAVAGVVVTASHNPKDDNGYKVYFGNGAQIISPHDCKIQESILENLEPWDEAWQDDLLTQIEDPYDQICDAYFSHLKSFLFNYDYINRTKISITFTSLHGVSHVFMDRAFREIGFPFFQPVPEQMNPDPEFPTVRFPNPEEGEGVLTLSFKTADENNSTLIVANDPDADRCAVAEKSGPNGTWRVFNGNELGALLGWWCWFLFKEKHSNEQINPSDCYMFSSTVSSKILNSFAKKEGFNFIETLTGFKWMGNKADELIKLGKKVVFAFEEAIGFMCDPSLVKDKDGISASILVAQMAVYLDECLNGRTLTDQLCHIYKEYGFHTSNNSYFLCYEKATIDAIFSHISSPYPTTIGPYNVTRIRDLNKCFDSSKQDHKPDLPCSSSSYMVTFYLDNGIVLTIRTSGTEPKIKYYAEAVGKVGDDDWPSVTKLLDDVICHMVEQLLQPEKNNLIPRPQ